MLGFIIFELFVLAFLWFVFIILMSFHRVAGKTRMLRWWRSEYSTQLVGVAILGIVESVALIALGTDHDPPIWVFAVIFGLIDIATGRWLYLVWRARKAPPSEVD